MAWVVAAPSVTSVCFSHIGGHRGIFMLPFGNMATGAAVAMQLTRRLMHSVPPPPSNSMYVYSLLWMT